MLHKTEGPWDWALDKYAVMRLIASVEDNADIATWSPYRENEMMTIPTWLGALDEHDAEQLERCYTGG